MNSVRAGNLYEVIDIEVNNPIPAAGSGGGLKDVWTVSAEGIRADVMITDASSQWRKQQIDETVTHVVTVPYMEGLTDSIIAAKNRVVLSDDTKLQIRGVTNKRLHDVTVVLNCRAGEV